MVPMEFRILGALQECLQELEDNVSSTEPHSQRGLGSQIPSRQLWEFFWDARHGKAMELFCLQDSQDCSTLGNLGFAAGRFLGSGVGWRIMWELRDARRWSCHLLFPGKSWECWHGRNVPEFPEDPGGSSPFPENPREQKMEFLIPLGSRDPQPDRILWSSCLQPKPGTFFREKPALPAGLLLPRGFPKKIPPHSVGILFSLFFISCFP